MMSFDSDQRNFMPLQANDEAGAISPESDREFIERQFCQSIAALERIHALSRGEFDFLSTMQARTAEEKHLRAGHHESIAHRALKATQQGLLREEDFNIWSGRRKEDNVPVKFRFERAYASLSTPALSRKRGALTGIVRSYLRLLDEDIATIIAMGDLASTAKELKAVEQRAVDCGYVVFEQYSTGTVSGWPTFTRSTGRMRGGVRLREYFENRQTELPMTESVKSPSSEAASSQYQISDTTHSNTREQLAQYFSWATTPISLNGVLNRVAGMFR